MPRTQTLKSILLGALIVLASVMRHGPAQAAPSEMLIVAGGCFWCVEADFEKVEGVKSAVSGFTGGTLENPTYKQVTAGGTGHYEAVAITFDPAVVSRRTLLEKFFRSVDPTDAGGQFCDRGESYRTAIFVSDQAEKALAEAVKAEAQAALGQKIVTPILSADTFYKAGAYHQDFYKSQKLMVTRFGPSTRATAYKRYRDACGRDQRVRDLWGPAAPFAGG